MLQKMRNWWNGLRESSHKHRFIQWADMERVPTKNGGTTDFGVLVCVAGNCPCAVIMPRNNFNLASVAFQEFFLKDLAELGRKLID